jgi:hypothetical protein
MVASGDVGSIATPHPDNSHPLCLSREDTFAGRLRRFWYEEQWFVAVRPKLSGADEFDLKDLLLLKPPKDRFYADPFVVEHGTRNYLFVEEFEFTKRKGVIACVEFDEQGFRGAPVVVLEAEHHLSYPFIFDCQGQTYMLPESRDSGSIGLYRATEFPFRWEYAGSLMDDVWAVDSTIFEAEGRFWMFAGGVKKDGNVNSELFLYYADSPLGPWHPHPMNPVVADAARARPAGMVFRREGALIRPGQDCSLRYGGAIVLNRIEQLSPESYSETPMKILSPDWFPGGIGTHTLNHSEHYQTVDALPRPNLVPRNLWRSLRQRLWKEKV